MKSNLQQLAIYLATTFLLILFGITISWAQPKTWGNLVIDLPEGWSATSKAGFFETNNSNIKGSVPFSITLLDADEYTGKLDTLFAHAWKKYMNTKTEEIPRWRRLYTTDNLLIQHGFMEIKQGGATEYLQFNVFVTDSAYQTAILRTTDTKAWRLVQEEWMDRLQGTKMVIDKKKKQ